MTHHCPFCELDLTDINANCNRCESTYAERFDYFNEKKSEVKKIFQITDEIKQFIDANLISDQTRIARLEKIRQNLLEQSTEQINETINDRIDEIRKGEII